MKISKNFENFVPIFLHIPKVLFFLKKQPLKLLSCSNQPLSHNKNFKFSKKKTFFFLVQDIWRPNLTFFLCFKIKPIKKSCLRSEKTTLILKNHTMGGYWVKI